MKRFLILFETVTLGIIMLVISGCTSNLASPSTTTSTAPLSNAAASTTAAAQFPWVTVKEWKIPTMTSLTGARAEMGEQMNWAREWARQYINSHGGIAGKPLVWDTYDNQYSPDLGAVNMSKVGDWALAVVGPWDGVSLFGVAPIASQKGIYIMTSVGWHDAGVQFAPWLASSWDFQDKIYVPLGRAWAKLQPDIKNVASFTLTQYSVCYDCSRYFNMGLEAQGVKTSIVNTGEVTTDFVSPAVSALGKGANAFTFNGGPQTEASILLELKKRGNIDNAKFIMLWAMDDPSWWSVIGDNGEGLYFGDMYPVTSQNPLWKQYQQEKMQAHQMPAYSWEIPVVDEVFALKAAIENQKITGDPAKLSDERIKIRDYINNAKNISGVAGPFSYTNGFLDCSPYLYQWHNGGWVLLGVADPSGNLTK